MITVGILTVSDRCSSGEREDKSGELIRRLVPEIQGRVVEYSIVPDEKQAIVERLTEWADRGGVDIIITTGGTGLAPRDVTPEATLEVIDKEPDRLLRVEGLRGGDAGQGSEENAALHAQPRGVRHPQQNTHHQSPREPQSSAGMLASDYACLASRRRDTQGRGDRVGELETRVRG